MRACEECEGVRVGIIYTTQTRTLTFSFEQLPNILLWKGWFPAQHQAQTSHLRICMQINVYIKYIGKNI